MQKFQLQLLFQIIGVGSASGLVYKDDTLYLISDNSGYLYEYNLPTSDLKKHPLFENPTENIPKPIKPDFESITLFGDNCYLFGSGSTPNRNSLMQWNTQSKKVISKKDLADLYLSMQAFEEIDTDNFNIEGSIYDGKNWYILNRGNGNRPKNVIFTVAGKNLTSEFSLLSNVFDLPKINGYNSSFTDAIRVDDKIYFLAAAENSNSTYLDGEVVGSLVGCIDIEKMTIDFTQKISDTQKFEGITLFQNSKDQIEFLLCEDNDTEILASGIYQLTLNK
jgi:hypothetical protein